MFRVLMVVPLLAVAAGCGTTSTVEEPSPGERLDALAARAPSGILYSVRQGFDEPYVVDYFVDGAEEPASTFLHDGDVVRAERPSEVDPEDPATIIIGDGEVCFDEATRPLVAQALAMSYGVAEYDDKPWSCSDPGFAMTRLLTWHIPRQDVEPRIDGLETGADWLDPVVEEVDGEELVHVRTTGLPPDGALNPLRPAYDLWIDADGRLVRMTSQSVEWRLDYPESVDVAMPPEEERGAYGYAQGPGQGTAKACHYSGTCGKYEVTLEWSDGRKG